jgi:hypothetical protein
MMKHNKKKNNKKYEIITKFYYYTSTFYTRCFFIANQYFIFFIFPFSQHKSSLLSVINCKHKLIKVKYKHHKTTLNFYNLLQLLIFMWKSQVFLSTLSTDWHSTNFLLLSQQLCSIIGMIKIKWKSYMPHRVCRHNMHTFWELL